MKRRIAALIILLSILAGCATTSGERPTGLAMATSPAWSLKATDQDMIVAVSPVRQSVQIFTTSAAVLGAGIDAVVNARHREAVLNALGDYQPGTVFEEKLKTRLGELKPNIARVQPLESIAGFHTQRDAEDARWAGLAKKGYDTVLDLKMTYGIFGYDGILVAKLDGRLTLLPEKETLWDNNIVVSSDPILMGDRLTDPTKRMGPNLSSPRFKVDESAMDKWTSDGGETIRNRFEAAADGAVSALLCDLGLANEFSGHYYLGKLAMNRKKFNQADAHFVKAIELAPANIDAQNGRAVNMAHNKQVDDAIALEKKVIEIAPDYAPGWMNLAWFYAIDKKDPATAKPYYEKAVQLGLEPEKKLEKALSGN